MDDLSFYCVVGVESSPVQLTRKDDGVQTLCQDIELPLPEQVLVFVVGNTEHLVEEGLIDVSFHYEGITVRLGSLTHTTRTIVWELKKNEDSLPDLLRNSCEGIMTLKVTATCDLNNLKDDHVRSNTQQKRKVEDMSNHLENSPQMALINEKTPSSKLKSAAKQRHKGSGKGERTPTGPTPNKMKIATRMRAFRSELKTPNKDSTTPSKDSNKENVEGDDDGLGNCSNRLSVCKDVTSRTNPGPSSRWGHAMCIVLNKMAVLVGGQGDKQQLSKDSIWTLNTETRKWKPQKSLFEGQNPELRLGHTLTYDPMVRCIYVYGGSKNLKWFRDVFMLDMDDWKWQLIKVNGKAPTRAYHTSTLYRHELWIFGGVYPCPNPQPDGCSNEIHIFSPVMESWYMPIINGEKPLCRSGHSATLIKDQLVVFGGWDAPIIFSDTFMLDMTLLEWSQPKIVGPSPKPRSWHASCALSGDRVLIHGGYDGDLALDDAHIFSMGTLTWTQIKVDPLPSPRTGHVAVCLPYYHENQEHDEVMIFGGGDNDGAFFTDLLSMYIPLMSVSTAL